MPSTVLIILAFVASGGVVFVAARALTRYADAIADATRIGRVWIGSVLLAGATSLPELTTDVAAVRLGAVDLAVGDLFGSSMANMLILAGLDLAWRRHQILRHVAFDHVLAGVLAIALNALAAVLVLMRPTAAVGTLGVGVFVLAGGYVLGTRAVYLHGARDAATGELVAVSAPDTAPPRLRRSITGFVLASLVIVLAAPAFAWAAKGIAERSGLGNTFVGTWLVGLSTSLPELVTSMTAVRLGAFDMAVGNLFGSNAFNMSIFLVLDAAAPGSLFAELDPAHAVSALFAVVLMALGIGAIVYRARTRFALLEPSSLLMLAAYLGALAALYAQIAGR